MHPSSENPVSKTCLSNCNLRRYAEGVELQKEWTLALGAAESQLSVAAGVGVTTVGISTS